MQLLLYCHSEGISELSLIFKLHTEGFYVMGERWVQALGRETGREETTWKA